MLSSLLREEKTEQAIDLESSAGHVHEELLLPHRCGRHSSAPTRTHERLKICLLYKYCIEHSHAVNLNYIYFSSSSKITQYPNTAVSDSARLH